MPGHPCKLFEGEKNPDYAPSLKLGHKQQKSIVTPPSAVDRYERAKKREDLKRESLRKELFETPSKKQKDECTVSEESDFCKPKPKQVNLSDTGVQTDISGDFSNEFDGTGRRFIDSVSEEAFKDNNEKVLFYTGLPSYFILMTVFNFVKDYIVITPTSSLSKFQQFVMTLMKLRLSLLNQDLGYRFKITDGSVSRLFLNMMDILFVRLKPLIKWPSRQVLLDSTPMCFRKHFGRKVIIIIDCFELFIDRPKNLLARAQTYSVYKHHNTVKFLIGIAPQGVVSFLSKAWGGRTSDKFITEHSGFLSNLLPGDVILADRGFDIDDSVSLHYAEVKIPDFTKGKQQMPPLEVERSRKIANVRIHVERVIGNIRKEFSLLNSQLPIDFLMKKDNAEYSTIDKIVTICCALCNLCDSVVPSD